jgi:hypothetical protein
MADDNPSKKSFERTAREAMERGTAATEQATKHAEQSYSSAAEGITEFNLKLLNIAQINAKAGMTFATELMHVNGPRLKSGHGTLKAISSGWLISRRNWRHSVRKLRLQARNH